MEALVAKRSSTKSVIAALFCLGIAATISSAAPLDGHSDYPDISVLSLSSDDIVFTYRPEQSNWTVDLGNGSKLFDIPRCAYNEKIGEARVPIRVVLIGLPPSGMPDISVLSSRFASIEPGAVSVNRPLETSFYDNARFQKAKAYASYPVVSFGRPYFIRDQRVIELHIDPVQLVGSNTILTVAEEITIRLTFNQAPTTNMMPSGDQRFEKIFRASLLNYEQARSWRVRDVSGISLSGESEISPFSQSSDWIKIGVTQSAIYGITPAQLSDLGVNVGNVDPRTFRVFWDGGRNLSKDNFDPRPQYREIAIEVTGDEDASFDGDDRVIFYMHGADFVDIDSSAITPHGVKNPYTTENFAWLTYGGTFSDDPRRMSDVSVTPQAAAPVFHNQFNQFIRFEEDRLLEIGSEGYIFDYFTWYWHDEGDYTISIQLDDLIPFQVCTLLVRSKDTGADGLAIDINGARHVPDEYVGVDKKFFVNDGASVLKNGLNNLVFHQQRYGFTPLLDNFDLTYPRTLKYSAGTSDFYTYNSPGTHRYSIDFGSTETGSTVLLHATDLDNQVFLTGSDLSTGKMTFDWVSSIPGFDRFALSTMSQLRSPSSLKRLTPSDLSIPLTGDLVVIAPESFRAGVTEYKSYREQQGYSIDFVPLGDIYSNYSGGRIDPVAIRDFLKYCFENSFTPPGGALLVGDGHYDFRNNLGRNVGNFVPPFVVEDDYTVSDENFVNFADIGVLDSDSSYGVDRGVDMVVARWPVRSSSEVSAYVTKLKEYESSSNYGPWRNVLTLVADDEFKSKHSKVTESVHTQQSEILASEHIPPSAEVQKIYMTDYPFDSFNQKPRARARVIQAINDGTVMINYIGHGNPDLWADERVFYWKEDLFKLTNRDKLAVIFNGSCSIGQFDSPLREAMAEELFRYNNGGAIATVAATRLVFSDPNAKFAYKAYDLLLGPDEYTICEAVYVAKLLRQLPSGYPIDNDRKFVVFGDPLMNFGVPQKEIVISSLEPQTLTALALTSVSGYVADTDGLVDEGFSGDVYISVFDAEREKENKLTDDFTLEYKLPGPRIFRGKGTVTGGRFEMQFVVPKDISYGESSAGIRAYAVSQTSQASGGFDSISISGSNPAITDTLGPQIEVELANGSPLEGGVVKVDQLLEINLFDSSGMNLSGEVGHGIEVTFDDDPLNDMDLTESFAYHPGSYQSGSVEFRMPDLPQGSHTLKVKAWDSANNSNLETYNVAIGEVEALVVSGVSNYPNPATVETRFSYHLSEPVSSVRIDVYSLRGRLIKTLSTQPGNAGYNLSSIWNMTDGVGDRLSNGVYIYKITASGRLTFASQGESNASEGFGKLVILR